MDHFLNHYLKNEKAESEFSDEVRDDRTSLNSNLDWGDKVEI